MITPIAPVVPATVDALTLPESTGKPGEFHSMFKSAVQAVETDRSAANQTAQTFLSGEGGELHSTVLAAQKAELSLELFLQVRNKVVQAYQEIMRSQI
jgi:flagellar hook-basal body complex protein FliE